MEILSCPGNHERGKPAGVKRSVLRYENGRRLSAGIIGLVVFVLGAFPGIVAAGTPRNAFSSPEEAVEALVGAVRSHDMKEMAVVLGPGSEELISSGDEVADRADRDGFLRAYDEKNSLREESSGKTVLCIGVDEWPMPIPILREGADEWEFNVSEGREEILNRRIGGNELYVIDVLHAYVDAQHEYASRDLRGAGSVEFAQALVSSEGEHDGLYWAAKEGEVQSPLGPLVARAAKEGYADADLSPYHGYYFKTLKEQGPNAEGGAYHYVVDGRMILGFALAAYPAEYGNSGVMTFMVNQGGVVYQKDFGMDTENVAESLHVFDPDETWSKAPETETGE
jgi:hypothetical protein